MSQYDGTDICDLGIVARAYNPSFWETDTGWLPWKLDQSGLYSEFHASLDCTTEWDTVSPFQNIPVLINALVQFLGYPASQLVKSLQISLQLPFLGFRWKMEDIKLQSL